ncbi:hypothetical protein NKH56_24460, partial [Mesorhizobium sp. M1076]|uniref:hypothetical protein n=1 Tax=Mesorhizobium sp. M1076 TaxID=2957054 RepID=UPI003336D2FF
CQWLAKQQYRRPHAMELPALNGLSCPLTSMSALAETFRGWIVLVACSAQGGWQAHYAGAKHNVFARR